MSDTSAASTMLYKPARQTSKLLVTWWLVFQATIISHNSPAYAYTYSFNGHLHKFGYYNSAKTARSRRDKSLALSARTKLNRHHNLHQHFLQSTSLSSSSIDASTTSSTTPLPTTTTSQLSTSDIQHMKQATTLARIGYGNTFPNPAVGCVLVRHHYHDNEDDSSQTTMPLDEVIGSGFHPKAGMPHAEVFALLEACDHIEDGVAGARSVMGAASDNDETTSSSTSKMLNKKVLDLLDVYKSKDGACKLFDGHFDDWNVTAYVTLEPCCHTGQTPPCAMSLVAAGVNRVVVGYRDPNPKVDGGGLQLLQNSGIDVQVLSKTKGKNTTKEEIKAATECYNLVKYFVKRISPREESSPKLDDTISGKKRRILRSIAGRQKTEGNIQQLDWPKDHSTTTNEEDNEESDLSAQHISINHRYLERIDAALWDHEIVLLRLNKVVKKKKEAKILGGRIAEILNAHVAQVIGHTSLLYRPGFPPVLDLDELILDEEDINSN